MFNVIVVDDSASTRRDLKNIINNIENFKVIDTAFDAFDAREKIKLYEPDLVTIDINMPKMDGRTFLRNLTRLHPMPAIIISCELVSHDEILKDGALDFIHKSNEKHFNKEFENKMNNCFLSLIPALKKYQITKPLPLKKKKSFKLTSTKVEKKIHPDEVYSSVPAIRNGAKIIAIGSSTGGVESLLKIFQKLPSGLPPIVITQHIPYGFSGSFAKRLNDHSDVFVSEVEKDTILENGHAYLAPGNMHLAIELKNGDYIGKLLDIEKVSRHKPSVDIMFRSINNSAGGGAMAIMMTGMGDDGTIAMKELYNNGAYTLAQNEESCVVFGMPAQAIKAGAIKDICHLDSIAQHIIDYSNNKKT